MTLSNSTFYTRSINSSLSPSVSCPLSSRGTVPREGRGKSCVLSSTSVFLIRGLMRKLWFQSVKLWTCPDVTCDTQMITCRSLFSGFWKSVLWADPSLPVTCFKGLNHQFEAALVLVDKQHITRPGWELHCHKLINIRILSSRLFYRGEKTPNIFFKVIWFPVCSLKETSFQFLFPLVYCLVCFVDVKDLPGAASASTFCLSPTGGRCVCFCCSPTPAV